MNDPKTIWRAAESAVIAGDVLTLERLLREHGKMFQEQPPESSWCGGLAPSYAGGEARAIIAREHHFADWAEYEANATAMRLVDSSEAWFEAAVDAVVAGDVMALQRLLEQHSEGVRLRSGRRHRSTLLHYVGANGVEGWRQRTPANAVQVAELLFQFGADVDAVAEMYGGSTTLGLVATSIHPLRAGLQNALIDILLAHGARFEVAVAPNYTSGNLINACLANGRPQAAEYLAERGAPLDLEAACGVGWLRQVKTYFDESGQLKSAATQAQMNSGFQWACEYGRIDVVDFLLSQGIAVGVVHRGQTGLHQAALGGQVEVVRLLLAHSAPVEVRDSAWRDTPLGWALHGWAHPPPDVSGSRYLEVVTQLVAAGAIVEPAWLVGGKVRGDAAMWAALRGEALPPDNHGSSRQP